MNHKDLKEFLINGGIAANSNKMATKHPFESNSEFSKFFLEFYPSLVLFSFRITDNQAAAEDIAEDSFITIWNKRKSLSEVNSLKSYLYTIARNRSFSWIRKNKQETRVHETATMISMLKEENEKTTLETLIYGEMIANIYSAMEKLPKQCRKVFTLHFIEGKKISEIAEELKISVGTANTHKFRGIHILQKALEGLLAWIMITNI